MWRQHVIPSFFFTLVAGIFFYKTILYGYLPIPGDLLVAEYNPWKSYSYTGYNPGSFPNKAQYFDVLRQLYPWKALTIDTLKRKELPLWNPYNFSGAPLLANFQSAVFYPFNVLYFLVSQPLAWSILVMFQPLLASLFTYFYARKISISIFGSFFASLSFSFSSFMTVWLEYNTIGQVILWLPLSLLSIEHLLKKVTLAWMIPFIFSLVASQFGGHPQIFIYIFVFVACYVAYRAWGVKRSLLTIACLSFLSLGIGAIQFVPGTELISQSARVSHDYDFLVNKILIQPYQLAMLFVPDFFGNPATRNYIISDTYIGKVTSIGLVPLFFVLLALIKKKNDITKFFGMSCMIVLFLATSNPFTQLLYRFSIPLFSASAPTLAIFLFCFSLSIVSGFGVDLWQKEKMTMRKFFYWIAPIALIFVILWASVFIYPKLSLRSLLYSTIILCTILFSLLIGTLKTKIKFFILIFLIIVQAGDLFRSFHKFNPFSPPELIFPKAEVLEFLKKEAGINRFWGYGAAAIEANFATAEFLYSPDGYDPLYPKRYGEFIQSSKNGKIETIFTTQTRSDAFIAHGFGEEDFSSNPYRLKVLRLLGIKYILDKAENASTQKTFPNDRFKLVYEKNGWKVFENLNVLPRAFLASSYQVFQTKEEFENIFFSPTFNPSKTILLEEDPKLSLSNLNHLSKLQPLSYQPNQTIFTLNTSTAAFLFLSDVYYPGWKAFIDGEQTHIYRANYAFRAVAVPAGEHRVVFTYDPFSFKIGLAITGISMAAAFFVCVILQKKTGNYG